MTQPKKRRARDPGATREIILEAASVILARQGPDALSVSAVAKEAGVNRGTAYQHFTARENLVNATLEWVSDRIFHAAFGENAVHGGRRVEDVDVPHMTYRLITFAMDNAELCRSWLLQLLASPDPAADPFWREYEGSIARFTQTELSRDDIDSEALSVLMLSGTFLWPVWASSHARDEGDRARLARRFARETLRLSLYGTMRPEAFPDVAERIARVDPTGAPALRSIPGGR